MTSRIFNKLFKRMALLSLLLFTISIAKSQWQQTGPEGGYIKCMAVSGERIFAVSGFYWLTSPGLYVSENHGQNWQKTESSTLPADIRAIATNGSSLFLGTGSGIYRSDDQGLTWTLKINGIPAGDKWINHLTVSGNTIFAAGTPSGILRSTDNGENWTVSNTGLTDYYIYCMVSNETTVFAGTGDQNQGVFRSTDNGLTWQQVKNGMAYYFNGQWINGEAPMITSLGFSGNDLYAGTSEFQGIWKSTDMGDNWTFCSMETMNYSDFTCITGNGDFVMAGTLNGGGVIKSLDNGAGWNTANNGIDNYGQITSFLQFDNNILVASKGGIYKTTNYGNEWTTSCNGINAQNITTPGFVKIGNNLFAGTERGGVFKSLDNGDTWAVCNDGLPVNEWNLSSLPSSSGALFAWDRVSLNQGDTWQLSNSPGWVCNTSISSSPRWLEYNNMYYAVGGSSNPGVYRSDNNSVSWIKLTNGLQLPDNTQFTEISTDGTNLFLSTSDGVYYSSDNGNNWSRSTFSPSVSFGLNTIAKNAYYTGNSTLIMTPGGLYHSLNHGITWQLLQNWSPPPSDYLVYFKKFYSSENAIFALGEYSYWDNQQGRIYVNNYYVTTDNGVTWTNITESFSALNINTLAVDGPNVYIVGKSNNKWNIYRSSDNGITWINISSDYKGAFVGELFINNDKIFAGTNGSSIWKRNLDEFAPPLQPGAIDGTESPCPGSVENYSVLNVNGVSYQWQFPQGWEIISGNGTNNVTVHVGNNAGIALVIPSNEFGTGPAQFKTLTPSSILQVSAVISSGQGVVCQGENISFTSETFNGGSQPEYEWYVNDILVTNGIDEFVYTPDDGDIVKLIFTSNASCVQQNQVESNAITVQVNSKPVVSWNTFEPDSLCVNWSPVLLSGGEPAGGIYDGHGVIDGLIDPSAAGSGKHDISYTYTDENGCSAKAFKMLTINICAGIPEQISKIRIYPNPATDILIIETTDKVWIEEIRLFDVTGICRLTFAVNELEPKIELPVRHLAPGNYYLSIFGKNEHFTSHIILK